MEKVKKFLDKRSKISLLVFLISMVVGILLIFEFVNFSEYIHLISDVSQIDSNYVNTYDNAAILTILSADVSIIVHIITCSIFVFICLVNIVGYVYNSSEFMLISTGLYIILFCAGLYIFEVSGVIFVACLFLLNLLGYIDQIKLTNKKK